MHDLKFAVRALTRTPGSSVLVVVTLAIAIATVTIIASTIDMVWRFIPTERTDRLVFVASTDPRPEKSQAGVSDGLARTGVSIPDLADWSERATSIDAFAAFTFQSAALTGLEIPTRILTIQATRNLPDIWGIVPQMGRTFAADEATPGRDQVVLVAHTFWQNQLKGAADVVGRTVIIDGRPRTIVGVLPQETNRGIFRDIDAVTPIVLDRERARRDDRRLYITAVLKPGVEIERAEAELATIARQLQSDYPVTNAQTGVVVRPLIELLGSNITAVVFLLSLIAIIVFCIACANVSSIILAHAATRRRELAVRSALGAGRWQQIRQFMSESLIISTVAGAVGLVLAWWGLVAIRFASANIGGGFGEITLNGRVLTLGLAVTLVAPFGFALIPAWRMSRPDMDELRQGNRGAESAKGRRLREALVVAQVALALVLLMQVALIGRTTWRLHYLERGFDAAQLLTLRMNLAEADYKELSSVRDFYLRALDRIHAVPGVLSAGMTNALPAADREVNVRFAIQGKPVPNPESNPEAARAAISATYLETMRIPVERGRGFVRADFSNEPPVALVNREAARRYWPGEDPIGRRIRFDDDDQSWFEVVGIVGNVRHSNAGSGPTSQVYVPSSWRPERTTVFVVRTSGGDATQLSASIRSAIAELDKTQPVYDVRSMQRVLVEDLGGTYLFSGMLAVFATVALLLAAAGLYGLVSFSVTQRTRELGLRMALGAQRGTILRMVVGRGSLTAAIGVVLGSIGAAALVSLTARVFDEVDLRDPLAYVAVAVPLLTIALLATYIPARRATRVDPLLALRAE